MPVLDQLLNGDLPSVLQSVDADGFFEYWEDRTDGPGNAMLYPVGNVLARWRTAGRPGSGRCGSGSRKCWSDAEFVPESRRQVVTGMVVPAGSGGEL